MLSHQHLTYNIAITYTEPYSVIVMAAVGSEVDLATTLEMDLGGGENKLSSSSELSSPSLLGLEGGGASSAAVECIHTL